MASPERALALTSLSVDVSLHDDKDMPDEEIMAHCSVAAKVIAAHLRKAKAELIACGLNINWSEKGLNG